MGTMIAAEWTPEQWLLLITGVATTIVGQVILIIKLIRSEARTVTTASTLAATVVDTSDELARKVVGTSDKLARQVHETTTDAARVQGEIAANVNGKLSVRLEAIERTISMLQIMMIKTAPASAVQEVLVHHAAVPVVSVNVPSTDPTATAPAATAPVDPGQEMVGTFTVTPAPPPSSVVDETHTTN